MSKGKFAVGALIGVAAGVIAGILTAPKSGKETRADMKEKAAELKREAAKRTEEVKDQSAKLVNEVKDKAEGLKDITDRSSDNTWKGFFTKESKK